jgi:hypothetical protein
VKDVTPPSWRHRCRLEAGVTSFPILDEVRDPARGTAECESLTLAPLGRGWRATGVVTSRGETGEGVSKPEYSAGHEPTATPPRKPTPREAEYGLMAGGFRNASNQNRTRAWRGSINLRKGARSASTPSPVPRPLVKARGAVHPLKGARAEVFFGWLRSVKTPGAGWKPALRSTYDTSGPWRHPTIWDLRNSAPAVLGGLSGYVIPRLG